MPRPHRNPNLTEYVQYAVSWRHRRLTLDIAPKALGAGALLGLGLGAIVAAFGHGAAGALAGVITATLVFAVFVFGAFRMSRRREDPTAEADLRLRKEAFAVAERLEALVDKKRLSRDLPVDVSILLEEAARNWRRVRAALESPYWRRAELPAAIRAAREQSLLAVDQGMQELLVLCATSIPEEPSKWTFSEVVDEVVGRDLLSTRGRVEQLSPFHDAAREVAMKIRELAEQVEERSQRLVGEQLVEGAPRPGSALEATLAELRQIKQAEEELREELRG